MGCAAAVATACCNLAKKGGDSGDVAHRYNKPSTLPTGLSTSNFVICT